MKRVSAEKLAGSSGQKKLHLLLVQAVHFLHILLVDFETSNLPIFLNAGLGHALWQRHITMLQAPSDQKLRRSARVLLRKRLDDRVLHLQSTYKRRIGLDDDAVFLAERGDICPGVERMDLDLVHNREYTRLRGKEFFELCSELAVAISMEFISVAYMLESKIADTSSPDFACVDCIFDRLPRLQSHVFTTIRAMEKEEIYVT